MNERIIRMDDQPMSARFFGESKWLTEFITPNNLEVQALYQKINNGTANIEDRLVNAWEWVAGQVRYKPAISGTLCIEGLCQRQDDLWCDPSLTIKTKVGNCANKAFLLASLARIDLSPDDVYCVLGNLHDAQGVGGHAWVQVKIDGQEYLMESTRRDIQAMYPVEIMDRYESIHYFNDRDAYYVDGRTVMEPYTAAYSSWLKDYLDMSYIRAQNISHGLSPTRTSYPQPSTNTRRQEENAIGYREWESQY